MICKECLNEFNGAYCPICGTPGEGTAAKEENIYNLSDENSFYPTTDANAPMTEEPKKKSNGLLIALIAIGAVLVIGVFAVIGLLVKDGKDNTEPTATAETTIADLIEEETTQAKEDYTESGADYTQSYNNIVEPDFLYNDSTLYVTPSVGLVLRTGPSENYSKILTIPFSKSVTVKGGCSSASKWIYVNYSGYSGWVHSDYLSTSKPRANYTPGTTKRVNNYYDTDDRISYSYSYTATVTPSKGLNIRSGATTSSYSYDVLPKGTTVTVLGESLYDSVWVYCCAYAKGNYYEGFVDSRYIK